MKTQHRTTHSNGKLRSIGNTIKGKRHGVWNYYYPNGYFHKQLEYKMGKLDGIVNVYDFGYNLICATLYKEGEPIL